ncbi:histidinol-phosphate transaminase [Paenibacillus oryzisoli]|uniref:histidinol-phosphate transaminase n=1 Tax=Paenibacillus oryzisoli TaxID=1850517 RepID=UPI003D2E2CC2
MKKGPGISNITSRSILSRMQPYSPGKPIWEVQQELGIERVTKLASNENPIGPSPMALEAIQAYLTEINRYPDADTVHLRKAIASHYALEAEQVLVTNGGDELITLLSETFLEADDEVIVPSPTFSEYEFGGNLLGAKVVPVPLREGFNYDVDDLLAAVTERTKLLYLCSPNNPTGTYMKKEELHRLVASLPSHVLVVYDGAYSHFVTADDYCDGIELVRSGFPIVVLQTFSKLYGLAGIRVGYGLADPGIIARIRQVKEPFNVNMLAQVAAAAAIGDEAHVEATRTLNEQGRNTLYAQLDALKLGYTPSMSNFVLVELGPDAKTIYDRLMQRGIIVRYAGSWHLPNHIRVSIGTAEEQDLFIQELTAILASLAQPSTSI